MFLRNAYGHAIAATAFPHAPWFVIPADQKWFARLVIVEAINEALASIGLQPVSLSKEAQGELAEARERLCSE